MTSKIHLSLFLFLLLFGLILLLTCKEKIPEGPPLVQVLEAELWIANNRIVYPQPTNFTNRYNRPRTIDLDEWEYQIDYHVPFQVKVKNIFDETIDGIEWTDVKINLWSTNHPKIECRLSFTYLKEEPELFVLHPGETHNINTEDSLTWDQTNDSGGSIFNTNEYTPFIVRVDSVKEINGFRCFCDTTYFFPMDTVVAFEKPIQMKAQADVKIFKNYEPVKSNIVDFQIMYFFPQGMVNKNRCPVIDGKLYRGDG